MDAIAALRNRDVTIHTVSGGLWEGRVDHILGDSAGDAAAIVINRHTFDGGGQVIIPWRAVVAVTPQDDG